MFLFWALALGPGCASDDDGDTTPDATLRVPDAALDAGLPTCCNIDPRAPTACGCVRIGGRTPADGVCPERCGVNPGDGVLVMSDGCFLNEIPSNSVCEAPDGG